MYIHPGHSLHLSPSSSPPLSISLFFMSVFPLLLCEQILQYHLSCSCVWLFGQQHARLPCPSPAPGACSNSCPLSWWCHLTISSSVIPFSSCLHSFLASKSFLMSWLGTSASASVLPMHIQGWFPLVLTDLIFLQSNGLSRVFSNTTVQKHQFFLLCLIYGPTLTSIVSS